MHLSDTEMTRIATRVAMLAAQITSRRSMGAGATAALGVCGTAVAVVAHVDTPNANKWAVTPGALRGLNRAAKIADSPPEIWLDHTPGTRVGFVSRIKEKGGEVIAHLTFDDTEAGREAHARAADSTWSISVRGARIDSDGVRHYADFIVLCELTMVTTGEAADPNTRTISVSGLKGETT